MRARARTTTRWALELRRRLRQGSRRPPVASVVRPHRHPDRAPLGHSPPNRATPLMATRVLRARYFVPSRCTRTPLKSCISPDFMLSIRLASSLRFSPLEWVSSALDFALHILRTQCITCPSIGHNNVFHRETLSIELSLKNTIATHTHTLHIH